MPEKLDLHKFSNIWETQGWSEAVEYKNSLVPSSLYKYSPLFSKTDAYYRKENKQRLNSLWEKQLWVSNYKYLNDPFEFKALFLDRERIRDKGWNIGDLEKCLEFAKALTQIGCFSNYGVSHMPLWAHYSNNHKGYCVKYKLLDKAAIYPVLYVEHREATATIPTWICAELIKGYEESDKPSQDFWRYLIYLFISFTAKFKHWDYEDEFRLICVETNVEKGTLVSLTQKNMEIEKIYVGLYCEHKEEIKDIGKAIDCEVYEMVFDEYSKEYELQVKRII